MEDVVETEETVEETVADLEKQGPGEIESLATELGWRPDGELYAK